MIGEGFRAEAEPIEVRSTGAVLSQQPFMNGEVGTAEDREMKKPKTVKLDRQVNVTDGDEELGPCRWCGFH